MPSYQIVEHKYDVVVVGAGGAGLRATFGMAAEGLKTDEVLIHIQAEDKETSMVSLTYRPDEVDAFAGEGSFPERSMKNTGWSVDMDEDETMELQRLTVLLFKVLLLVSSEGHGVRRTREKPTKRQGGKPGMKNRPSMERLIVEYLPKHLDERKAAAQEAAGGKREFEGRRGHWRHFRSDRFVNLQGTKKFIYPIPGPDGTVPRRKLVVK